MKKALFVATVLLFCIGLIQYANAGAPTLHLVAVGAWTGTINTHVIACGSVITDAGATFIASHFDLVDLDFNQAASFQKVKTANPTISLVGYRNFLYMFTGLPDWNIVNQNEGWFLHTKYGNTSQYRVMRNPSQYTVPAYVMNPSSFGWRNYIAKWASDKLASFPFIDGILGDDVAEAIRLTWDPFNVPVTALPSNIVANWNSYMIGLISTVKSAIGSHLLIVNTPDLNGLFIQYCDGQSVEHFLHRAPRSLTDYTQTRPIDEMKLLEKLSATGKIVATQSGAVIPQNPTPSDIELVHKCVVYCLSGFLLAYSGKATFGFQTLKLDYTGHNCYWDEMDAPIGTAVGARYNIQGDLWARDFTAGRVFLNIGDLNTYTVNVKGTTYTVRPRSGLIVPSEGPYNPPVNTQIAFTLSPNPAGPGQTVTLSGTLKTAGGSAVYPAQVNVAYSTNGGTTWNPAWTLNTNNAGAFFTTFAAPGAGTYLLRASYSGSSTLNPSSYTQTLPVQTGGKVNTQIAFSFSPNPASPGRTVTLSGTLKNVNGNPVYPAQVTVQYSTNGGATWNYILTLNTNTAGQFSVSFGAPGRGTYLARVSYAGSASYNPSNQATALKIQ